MDWLQFFSSIVGSIAWPAAIVALACLMRNPLAKLIPLIRTLKYKDFQIDIGEELEEARELVDAESEQPSPVIEEPPVSFKALAQTDPRAAILSAWFPVERELNEISFKKEVDPRLALIHQLRELYKAHVIDHLTFTTLTKLRQIRNAAAHVDTNITFDDAINMAEMCQWAMGQLKQINASMDAIS
ncbi:DUF4145 domain-containing protein [Pseudomonas gingeri]|uniref:DUF4145 domain-containing protein n=1 Tax=Pseudomonas gingeri TaxID=117681 RepID=UPI0015BA7D23|nr:DUF4145 domain-containing protein [Pseudomonas gingeri]NWD47847.1 DUF4145 domain-containing protein [Pseudomonas gingeri]